MSFLAHMVDAAKKHPAVLLGGTAAVIVLIMIRSIGSKTTAGASGVYAMMSDPTAVAANTQLVLAQDALSANGATLAAQVQMNADNNAAALVNAQIQGNVNSQYIAATQDITNNQTAAITTITQGQTSAAQSVALAQTAGAVTLGLSADQVAKSSANNTAMLSFLDSVEAQGNGTNSSIAASQVLSGIGQNSGVNVAWANSADVAASNLMNQFASGSINQDQLNSGLATLQNFGLHT